MLLQPCEDVREVEDGAGGGADGVGEGLEGDGAEVERKALEGGSDGFGFRDASTRTGAVGVFRGPFRVRYIELIRACGS